MSGSHILTRRSACKVIAITLGAAACRLYLDPVGAEAKTAKKAKKKPKPKWYSIVYKLNGGTNRASQVKKVQQGKSIAVSKLKTPKLKGHVFCGWYQDAKLTKKASRVYGKKSARQRTLYAKWKLGVYRISYYLYGGQAAWAKLPTSYQFGDAFKFPLPIKEGSVFLGWFRDEAFTVSIKRVRATSTGERTLYARWLPTDYWNDPAAECLARINGLLEAATPGRADAFVFITDMHLPNNALVSPELIRRIRRESPVEKVIFGGDALNGNTTGEEATAMLRFLKQQLSGGTTWYVRGNHDSNDQQVLDDPTWALSEDQYRDALFEDASYLPDDGFYYYRDNADAKLRYVILDTGHGADSVMGDSQVEWLKERVLELPDGWTALVVQHKFFSGSRVEKLRTTLNRGANGELTCAALDEVYDQAQEKGISIAGVICGHCHRDYAESSEKGYPIVATTCDAGGSSASYYDIDHPLRERGTTDEAVFDVVVVDTEKRTLDFVRFGCGEDRSFSY